MSPRTEKRVQYYTDDLAALLGIGEIADMHVHTTDAGHQVLRVTYYEPDKDAYTTIKASKTKPKGTRQREDKKPGRIQREPKANVPEIARDVKDPAVVKPGLAKQIGNAAVDWLKKPMKRPDEW